MKIIDEFKLNFKDKDLLLTALTHSSYSNEHNCNNYERLEFLGDSVLQIIITEYFYINTDYKEGDMSKKRSSYVCEAALYEYAKEMDLIPYIRVGHGQVNDINETIVADVFEAFLGAVYLEFGLDKCKEIITKYVLPHIKKGTKYLTDYKSALQELVQTDKKTVIYKVIEESGPAHDKTFKIECIVEGITYGTGTGKSKKEAEQNAAKDAYNKRAK